MKISIITLFPKMLSGFFEESIIKRAQQKGLVDIELVDLRDYTHDAHRTVDDRPYGGGAGMVMRVEPVDEALTDITKKSSTKKVLCMSAKGTPFDQNKAWELAKEEHLVILVGHYEGYDERIMPLVDEELSLGDFVLTGGEIAAAAVTDAVVRLIPGVLKKDDATAHESFFMVNVSDLIKLVGKTEILEALVAANRQEVALLEYPHYTRPEVYKDQPVPEILLSGHHKQIEEWRMIKAYEETLAKRPDLLKP
ncbi:MAG: hypothetical protein RI947_476 [Candidatus Parcubacteria bacterium]|jgi:tRNA (guanine37-N1)-methyltransferase